MSRTVSLLIGVVVAVGLGWFFMSPGRTGTMAVNLVEQLASAKDRRPNPETFELVDATLAGDTRQAILTRQSSRLVYAVTVPDDGELRVGMGLLEDAWTTEGDGVLFRVLIGAGAPPEEVLNLVINPFGNPGDRRWHDVTIDLSEYAGETIDVFFNTNASPPMRPPVDDRRGDLAVWAPAVYAR